jgi:hypothetical protein
MTSSKIEHDAATSAKRNRERASLLNHAGRLQLPNIRQSGVEPPSAGLPLFQVEHDSLSATTAKS